MSEKSYTRRAALRLGRAAAAVQAAGLLATPAVLAQGGGDTLKVASVNSMSGGFARYGQELERGLEIAVQQVNAKGLTIGGRTYRVVTQTYDDKTDASTSARLVERAATSDGAQFIIAGCGSVITKAIIPTAQRLRMPLLTHWAQVDGVFAGQKGNPYLFGAMPPFSHYYTRISEMAAGFDAPKVRRVAMITPNDELGVFTAREYLPADMRKSGLELVGTEMFPPRSQDFASALDRLRRLEPDMFVINCYTPDIIAVFKEMQAIRFFPSMIVVEAPTSLHESLGDAINGAFVPTFWDPTLDKTKDAFIGTSRDFANLYSAKHNAPPPDFVAACGANNLIVMAQAMMAAGKVGDNRALLSALRDLNGETFFSRVKFDDDGLNRGGEVYPSQFQGGRPQLVYPPEVRRASPIHPYSAAQRA
ncbi:ABC transporter substrate-binding protein [Roseomonas chloroacetimidivorans]|uniref:ABC transporter substrate-binding protein n=1 Tax=Roseomonas chloroacetimidivorans TaxID=1766656 RepID=UPI003C762398